MICDDNNRKMGILPCGDCQCSDCGALIGKDKGVMLLSCFHPFCRDCLSTLVRQTDAYQIPCPLALTTASVQLVNCGGYVSLNEIRAVATENDFQEYCCRSGHNYTEVASSSTKCVLTDVNSKGESPRRKFETEYQQSHSCSPINGLNGSQTVSRFQPNGSNKVSPIKAMTENLTYDDEITLKLAEVETTCLFCCDLLQPMHGIVLQTCFHVFCKNCLKARIASSNGSQIKCLVHEVDQCGGYLLDREIKAIVSKDVYKKYKKLSEALAFSGIPNIFQCALVGCTAKCFVEDSKKVFVCPVCNSKNCLSCKVIHDGMECTEYQTLLQEAISSGKDLKLFHQDLSKELKNGFDQLSKKVAHWKLTNGASSFKTDLEVCQEVMAAEGMLLSDVEFECQICFDNVDIKQGMIIQECLHCYCLNCMVDVVRHSETSAVKCPCPDCMSCLTPREIKALVPDDVYEKHLFRSVKQAENTMPSFHCKTPDCTGWCEIEDEGQDGQFICFICQKVNCFKCKAIHGDLSCEDYQNRLVQDQNDIASENALQNMVNNGEGMKCPTCKVVVQKVIGCDWICCALCRTELCWATKGPRWGPRGNGDTSGGCGCMLTKGGPKCTPNCGNCH